MSKSGPGLDFLVITFSRFLWLRNEAMYWTSKINAGNVYDDPLIYQNLA